MCRFRRKETCLGHGHNWKGFDISGHTFILIFCNLVIIEVFLYIFISLKYFNAMTGRKGLPWVGEDKGLLEERGARQGESRQREEGDSVGKVEVRRVYSSAQVLSKEHSMGASRLLPSCRHHLPLGLYAALHGSLLPHDDREGGGKRPCRSLLVRSLQVLLQTRLLSRPPWFWSFQVKSKKYY